MKTQQRKIYTNQELISMLKSELEKNPHRYSDRRKTLEEMLRMRGVNLSNI